MDDIFLWKCNSDFMKLERYINLVFENIQNFSNDYKLCFNPIKSLVNFFTINRKLYNFHSNILLNDQQMNVNKHLKYFSFELNPEILRNKYIDHLALKARKRLSILKYILGHSWGADTGILRSIHISVIRPILKYGIPIYFAFDTNFQKLEMV